MCIAKHCASHEFFIERALLVPFFALVVGRKWTFALQNESKKQRFHCESAKSCRQMLSPYFHDFASIWTLVAGIVYHTIKLWRYKFNAQLVYLFGWRGKSSFLINIGSSMWFYWVGAEKSLKQSKMLKSEGKINILFSFITISAPIYNSMWLCLGHFKDNLCENVKKKSLSHFILNCK